MGLCLYIIPICEKILICKFHECLFGPLHGYVNNPLVPSGLILEKTSLFREIFVYFFVRARSLLQLVHITNLCNDD